MRILVILYSLSLEIETASNRHFFFFFVLFPLGRLLGPVPKWNTRNLCHWYVGFDFQVTRIYSLFKIIFYSIIFYYKILIPGKQHTNKQMELVMRHCIIVNDFSTSKCIYLKKLFQLHSNSFYAPRKICSNDERETWGH